MEEVTTIPQEPVVKKTRKSRAKVAPETTPAPIKKDRTLAELTNIAFTDMSAPELVLVASSLSAEYQALDIKVDTLTQQVGILKRHNNRMLATMAYIKQTMDHATTSITLQIGTCDD